MDIANASGEGVAGNYVGRIIARCLSLERFPQRGTIRTDIRPHLRIMGFARSTTVAFSIDTSSMIVAVHGVFHGGQDYGHALRATDDD